MSHIRITASQLKQAAGWAQDGVNMAEVELRREPDGTLLADQGDEQAAFATLGFLTESGDGDGKPGHTARTDDSLEADVREELDGLFAHLADRWDLKFGGVDPMRAHHWEEIVVPQIVAHATLWYHNNQPATEYVTVVLEVPAGASEGIDDALAPALATEGFTIAATYPGDLITDEARR